MIALEEGVPLSRFTTIGTGGPARYLARPATVEELREVLAWAAAEELPVAPIGLGSNLLVHDDGFDGLALKLTGDLVAIAVEGTTLVAGGGATNAVCLHRARDAGLGGLEFASAIPGTAGGGTRMNAGAYGRDWATVVLDADVVDATGMRTLTAQELGFAYRHSELRPGAVVARVRFALEPRPVDEIKARVADLLAARKSSQPTTKRTFGSVFVNPDGERGAGALIESVGLKGHQIGGALISPVHANFIENAGDATSADAIALMAEARRRVYAEHGLELRHEVRFLGPLLLPPL